MADLADAGVPRPELAENYRDFEPPAEFRSLVEDLLKSVPPKYLVGLKTIVLTNREALTRDQRRQRVWSRNRKVRLAEVRGAYYRSTRNSPASVTVYVDNILASHVPPWITKLPFLRYWELDTVLFHEIGHHIHVAHVPVYEGKENIAEDWSRTLKRRFFRRHYWYALPLCYPLAFAMRLAKRIVSAANSR
jgi:hypothetical protein